MYNTHARDTARHLNFESYFMLQMQHNFFDLSFFINRQLNHDLKSIVTIFHCAFTYCRIFFIIFSHLLLRMGLATGSVSASITSSLASKLPTTTSVYAALASWTSPGPTATTTFEATIVSIISVIVYPGALLISVLVIAVIAVVCAYWNKEKRIMMTTQHHQ